MWSSVKVSSLLGGRRGEHIWVVWCFVYNWRKSFLSQTLGQELLYCPLTALLARQERTWLICLDKCLGRVQPGGVLSAECDGVGLVCLKWPSWVMCVAVHCCLEPRLQLGLSAVCCQWWSEDYRDLLSGSPPGTVGSSQVNHFTCHWQKERGKQSCEECQECEKSVCWRGSLTSGAELAKHSSGISVLGKATSEAKQNSCKI